MQISVVNGKQVQIGGSEIENPIKKAENEVGTSEIIESISNNVKTVEVTTEEKKQSLIDAIEKASGKIENSSKNLEFSIHKETNQIMIKVVDKNTKEVIKEIPSEKILDMIAKMVELSGSFIDERR